MSFVSIITTNTAVIITIVTLLLAGRVSVRGTMTASCFGMVLY